MYDLIIIGGCPAGLSAGIYAARKRVKTLLLTKDFVGQITKNIAVENYPGFSSISGMDLLQKFIDHVKNFEIGIKENSEAKDIKKIGDNFTVETSQGEKFESKTVIITSGRNPKLLSVPGENEFMGRGVSYCSTCDAPFFKDKTVAVIGGGNSGFEAALDLTKYAKKVYILEAGPKAPADEITQEKVRAGNAEIIMNARAKEIGGNGIVEKLVYKDMTSGQTKELAVQGIFVEIGSTPADEFLKELVDFNEAGEIKINLATGATKTPGLFAAGDVTEIKYKQVVIAAGEGAKTALAAYDYLQKVKI